MKNLFLNPGGLMISAAVLLLIALIFATSRSSNYKALPSIIDRPNYAIFEEVIDGHKYLILDGSYSGGIVHKTTCPNHE